MQLPDDLRHPSGGEQVDRAARDAVRLAHRVLERFPDVVKRHKFIAGGAAVSSALVVLAGVAVARRVKRGESPDEAVASVTEAELRGLHIVETEVEDGPEAGVDVEASGDGGALTDTPADEDPDEDGEPGEDRGADAEQSPAARQSSGGA